MNSADRITTLAGARALAAVRARRKPATPIALACRLRPGYRITPSLALISDLLVDCIEQPDRRYIVSCPPRTGKTLLGAIITPVFALMRDPDASVLLAAHGDELATESSREARRLIIEHKDLLPISLDASAGAVGRWKVAGRRGGVWAGAVTGGPVGFGVSEHGLLLVDDPVRGAVEADSPAYRRRLYVEFKNSLLSRLEPGASCVILSSRWSERDLAGELLAEPGSPWRLVNIPAVATAGVQDDLHREPGAPVVNALGRDLAGWQEIRRAVGERAWAAMYLGAPSTPAGSLVKSSWIDQWRLPCAPPSPTMTVVGVDPAETGENDQAGIVAASMTRDGVVAVVADRSARLTSDAWARAAVQLAIDTGASQIAVESFNAGTTYQRVVTEALARYKTDHPIRVTAWPPKGSGRGRGDAMARAAALLQGFEAGTCRVAGVLPDLELQATAWQQGQHCPDSLSALVVAHDVLVHSARQVCTIVAPLPGVRLGGGGAVVTPIDALLRQRRTLGASPGTRTGTHHGRDRYRDFYR